MSPQTPRTSEYMLKTTFFNNLLRFSLVEGETEMEFLNGIYSQDFWAKTRVFSDSGFMNSFLP
jgi:hypothetical protein